MSIANQYSYIFIGLGVLVALIVLLRLRRVQWGIVAGTTLVVMAALTTGYFALRPGLSDVNSVSEAEAIIRNGNPTMVEFFSNYCAGCLSVRPEVDRMVSDIQARYSGTFNVLRVDIHTDFGRELRQRYGFSFTPEFILFDRSGSEVWRAHYPPAIPDIDRLVSGERSAVEVLQGSEAQ